LTLLCQFKPSSNWSSRKIIKMVSKLSNNVLRNNASHICNKCCKLYFI